MWNMRTSVELSKVILSHLDIFLCCHFYFLLCWTHTLTLFVPHCHLCICRWYSPSNPRAHWHTTRGAHTRSCKLCINTECNWSLIPAVLSNISNELVVFVFRSSMDRGNTRSVWRVQLVPLRFCWSIRTRPVPLLLFCPSRLQMTYFRTSQHQHLPPNYPQQPHRCKVILALTILFTGRLLGLPSWHGKTGKWLENLPHTVS